MPYHAGFVRSLIAERDAKKAVTPSPLRARKTIRGLGYDLKANKTRVMRAKVLEENETEVEFRDEMDNLARATKSLLFIREAISFLGGRKLALYLDAAGIFMPPAYFDWSFVRDATDEQKVALLKLLKENQEVVSLMKAKRLTSVEWVAS